LKQHIQSGDIYEINFCQEFFSEATQFNPLETYINLKQFSPTPFSAYYRSNHHYLICASPERFLMKKGNEVISQPIKGTIKRGTDIVEDEKLKKQLKNDEKERAENIMIVDLVRNDLSRIAKEGSVKVNELCKIYSYPQLHQMISTISAKVDKQLDFTEIIKACFPMGSMTGAPKIKAMELIEKYESFKRGLFSGSVGYITPEGDFDFNVVIRSLFYNSVNHYLSFMVGSAITAKSDPEKEYEECLLKAKGILLSLNADLENC
jgi:para-aminobenzoate synthetase component 1